MGVTGLWQVVAPTARPTSLATLNRKRLAVDASIWIYQFLKAVRDKEGNALRNSHVVGFFRRICKLLYFGIKPVFVFDGGAPGLKRETVRQRRRRREGRREDAVRTAGRLLAVQMERQVEEEKRRRERQAEGARDEDEGEALPGEEELVYVDEIGMGEVERKKERREGFRRKDQYHLPDLDVRIEDLGQPNDPRIMSQGELEEYARQFHAGEDINLYDFSKIDFESPFFLSLPPGDRYNILNAARLRSRLRMGYSKDQLDAMFPDRMAFSKFQIERVRERSELTQRLMNLDGDDQDWDINQGGRIAGEKGKEYMLVKNDGVDGGWALGVVSNKEGRTKESAIDLDVEEEDFDDPKRHSSEDEEFEDVAIEGLNRLPSSWKRKRAADVDYDMSYEDAAARIAKKRQAVYEARKAAADKPKPVPKPAALPTDESMGDELFVQQGQNVAEMEEEDDLFEDVDLEARPDNDEEDDLARAIEMSLEHPDGEKHDDQESERYFVGEDEDDGLDMQAALAESRRSKHQPITNVRATSPKPNAAKASFDGPLPFESLNLGQSLLGKKKARKNEEDLSGGFDRDLGDKAFRKEQPPRPMPTWFDAAPTTKDMKQMRREEKKEDDQDETVIPRRLRKDAPKQVIDLEAESSQQPSQNGYVDISSDEEDDKDAQNEQPPERHEWEMPEDDVVVKINAQEETRKKAEEEAREERYRLAQEIAAEGVDNEPIEHISAEAADDTINNGGLEAIVVGTSPPIEQANMNDVAEEVQAKPPPPTDQPDNVPTSKDQLSPMNGHEQESEDERIDWSASEDESEKPVAGIASETHTSETGVPVDEQRDEEASANEDDEFEDVTMAEAAPPQLLKHTSTASVGRAARVERYLVAEDEDDEQPLAPNEQGEVNARPGAEEDYFSDSDEELMRQLALESEEHARFASSLSITKDPAQAQRDYENELKQLRNQQKKDRRDADEVTQTMILECQALLRLFGLPYITAPMEAEAQCAELVTLGLVDGIVTDDSDIFLFGGTRIYKNLFNAAKFVECYLASDLEKEYALDRKKLIRFAHLLGSDYTEGIPGIGPVSALEILTDFATLEEFKEWCSKVQLGRPQDLEGQLTTPFRRKFKNAAQKRVFLPTQFPDVRVDYAYLKPEVDSSPDEFQWGVPDLDRLRSFLMATIGWSQDRTDEILVPVVRDMNQREKEGTQANITRFFEGGVGIGAKKHVNGGDEEGTAPRNRTGKESGRMSNAFKRLRGEAERKKRGVERGEEMVVDDDTALGGSPADGEKPKPKARGRKRKQKPEKNGTDAESMEADGTGDDEAFEPKSKSKKTTKTRRLRRQVDDTED